MYYESWWFMNIKIRRNGIRILNVLLCAVFVYLLLFPEKVTAPTLMALRFCGVGMIPSLFVYLVLAKRIAATNFVFDLCSRTAVGNVFILCLGLVCGFPSGAANCAYLCENGIISKKRAEYLCCLCSGPSLSFYLAFVGAQTLESTLLGAKLFLFQILAIGVTSLLMYPFLIKKDNPLPRQSAKKYIRKLSLTDIIGECAYLTVKICGFVCFFFVLGWVVSDLFKENALVSVILRGLFEFSSGISSAKDFDLKTREALCCVFLGFGSVSAILQTVSVANKVFSLKPFIVSRFIIAAVMTLLALIT